MQQPNRRVVAVGDGMKPQNIRRRILYEETINEYIALLRADIAKCEKVISKTKKKTVRAYNERKIAEYRLRLAQYEELKEY